MGRMGSYKYIDIDDICLQAMVMADELKTHGGVSHPVPLYGGDKSALNLLSQSMADSNVVPNAET